MNITTINAEIDVVKQLKDEHRAILAGEMLTVLHIGTSSVWDFRPQPCPLCAISSVGCYSCLWERFEGKDCNDEFGLYFGGSARRYRADIIISCLERYERWLAQLTELASLELLKSGED